MLFHFENLQHHNEVKTIAYLQYVTRFLWRILNTFDHQQTEYSE